MYWWILFGVSLALGITAVIVSVKSYDLEFVGAMTALFSFTVALILGIVCVASTVKTPQEVNQFKYQKQYIENHIAKDSIENAALTTEKIKQNKWLYDAQYSVEHWHGWTFYPNSVKDLKPIK